MSLSYLHIRYNLFTFEWTIIEGTGKYCCSPLSICLHPPFDILRNFVILVLVCVFSDKMKEKQKLLYDKLLPANKVKKKKLGALRGFETAPSLLIL